MPSATSGRILKTSRGSKKTPHQKNHRWESFSQKISKLHSLDPLRKVRRHDLDAEDLSVTTSYLRNGLDKWAELNISRPYQAFKREINPLTESLAQILYHEDRIMDLLVEYISRHEKEALEPLLDLVTAFAHDLGVRFEKHYPRALSLIVDLAGSMHDVEVIEWTFAALAFLFKYLSRLLVPDLRPTYDVVAPLMGKAKHPGHIARFSAEAMSFLVKKAAAPSHKDKALSLFIEHVKKDLESMVGTKQFDLYSQGIMTMFAEAMKGVGEGLHSTAPDLFSALMRAVPKEELSLPERTVWSDVCCGVITSVIHHSNTDTFNTVESRVVDDAMACQQQVLFIRVFGTMAGVRKGTRIHDWASFAKALNQMLVSLGTQAKQIEVMDSSRVWKHIIVNSAIVWSRAPMDALIPAMSTFQTAMTKEPWMKWYIPFCSYLADQNAERFRGLFLKEFQKFIVAHWSQGNNEDLLCVLIPRMVESGGLPAPGSKEIFPLPQSWQDQIVSKFVRLEDTPFPESGGFGKDPETWRDKCLPKYSARLRVLKSTTVHPSTNSRIAEVLLKKLKLALRPSSSLPTDEANFITSDGFHAYLRMCKAPGSIDPSLAPLLRAAAPRFCRSPSFLQALLAYEQEIKAKGKNTPESDSGAESSHEEHEPLINCLIANLSSPSHELRLASLQILEVLDFTPDSNNALSIMIQTEEMPLNLQSVRAIGAHLRRLGLVYSHIEQDSWLARAVPSFLWGMMTVPLAPVWDDAVEAMKKVAESKHGEEVLANIAFDWLDVPSPQWSGPYKPPADDNHGPLTNFECLNLIHLTEAAEATNQIIEEPGQDMLSTYEEGQKIIDLRSERARSKALKALAALPWMAERRSRKLVPHLFAFTDDSETPEEDIEEESPESGEGSWNLADRKDLIKVFSQFSNPRVLYLSQKVYQALLKLLANGDIELQKLALKAILTWKSEGIKPYQEHLEYLLDEARFKNELTVLFQGDNKILPEHRSEVIPVLLHLLYGRAISRKGAASGRHGLHATRLAIIRQLDVEDMGSFLDIGLGPLRAIRVVDEQGVRESVFAHEPLPPRKQVGLLNMLEAVINELGTSVEPYMDALVNSVLYCLVNACRKLGVSAEEPESGEGGQIENESLYRVIRTTALKSLSRLFQNAPDFNWVPYRELMVKEIISPRIEKLPVESTQGVSATWRLMATWSSLPKAAPFLNVDKRILPKIVETLSIEKAKDEVKVFALDILKNLINLAQAPETESQFNELIKTELLDPNTDLILKTIGGVLHGQSDIGRELLSSAVDTVVVFAPMIEVSSHIQDMLEIATWLLNQPLRKVNPKVKGAILLILKRFIELDDLQSNQELQRKVYSTISALFGFFKDKQNRQTLAEVLDVFARREVWAQEVSDICRGLNSYVEQRLDEPDYNTRLAAFNSITKDRDKPFTLDQWMPLVHNLLYFIQQPEEFGVLSSNSADGLCKFISAVESVWATPDQAAWIDVVANIILPAIYAGSRDPSETVRREILRVFGFLVSHLPQWELVADLTCLVPESEDSDEAFFFHIMSPAVSRQLQALRVLEAANDKREFRSKHISQFFIPLFEHFIFDRPEGGDDHGLSAQATNTIAALTLSLEWQQYRAILRRFISYVESKPDWQKRVVRLLEKEVDALRTAVASKKPADAMEVDGEAKPRRLASTLPDQEKLGAEIVNNFLPTLLNYIHEKDETNVSARVPVGVIIAKLLTLLPDQLLNEKLPGVLTDICHILRSKAWESREMARDTLSKIAGILGPEKFEFIVRELRGSLQKGYQLHVLGYTLHSILLVAIPSFPQGSLDYCLGIIMTVIMDDIFGVTGQEKDAEDYVSSMKEVKSSKSQDSMELLAKTASITRLSELTLPLQSLLMEKLDLRTVRKIDELLLRITKGLLENPAAASQEVLVFCYEVIQEVYRSQKPEELPKMDPRLKRFIVQKAAKKSDGAVTAKHTYKMTRFAIDILRAVMKKHDHLRTAANLIGFLPVLGDAVLAVEEEVKVSAFKMLTVIVKVPFKNNESNGLYKVAHKEAIKSIAMSSSTQSELAQAALKLISVILRDRRDIQMREAALDMLLSKLKDDLTEPLYRHVTFNFLRSVLDRKLETASVYDTLDHVGTVMITNDDKDTRDLARGAFFQFLREYPQKRNRWEKQLKFIVANLKYEREGGRLSVMECINLLLKKSADEFTQEVAATCFIPLVFVLANDDSDKCRLAAGELIKETFRVADKERQSRFLTLLRGWIAQDGNMAVVKLALHAFGLYFEGREPSAKDINDLTLVYDKLVNVLGDEKALEDDWELAHVALGTLRTLVLKHPQKVLSGDATDLWAEVQALLAHSHTEVKLSAIRLLSMYLADFAKNTTKGAKLPLSGSHGLQLDTDDVTDLVRLSLGILSAPEVDEALAQEVAQVLLFLGGYLELAGEDDEEEGDEAEEDEANDAKERAHTADVRYLFWKLASIIRKERPPKPEVLVSKHVAMDLVEAFCNRVSVETIMASIKTILRPLRNLTDPSIKPPHSLNDIFRQRYDELKNKAQTVMELLQRRLGSAEYTKALLAVSEMVREKRQQRSTKRKIEALTAPEKYGREKRKKFEKKKERRKIKGREARELRKLYH